MLDFVIGDRSNSAAAENLIDSIRKMHLDGTMYIGYPVLSTADGTVFIDALLTSKQHGVVVFNFLQELPTGDAQELWRAVEARHNDLYVAVENSLRAHRELRDKTTLAVPLHVVTYSPYPLPPHAAELEAATPHSLEGVLSAFPPTKDEYLRPLNAAIQRTTTIKPPNKRQSVQREDSRGAKLKRIEREIANLDRWQRRAAVETPEGAQRIRGLAGSGKTVVLALKAAYLHAKHPDWNIVVTFHTRSLYQQFQDLVRRFSYEHLCDEPNWDKLRILHSWGLYAEVAGAAGVQPRDFSSARSRYGGQEAFDGVCRELVERLAQRSLSPLYDAVLIDEAQDFPQSFFRLVYQATEKPKRIVWAYDELQNLGNFSMAPPDELFGVDAGGRPLVELHNVEGKPQQDIILPVCYRNTPWALATAHAVGFGVYRDGGLVQSFDDPNLWTEIGYEVRGGELAPGKDVILARAQSASPEYFSELLQPQDAIQCLVFADARQQAQWVADQIKTNITRDELEIGDVLIVLVDPLNVSRAAGEVMGALRNKGLPAHLAGVTSSRDLLFTGRSVAITGIYRAKGNEAPMVYVLHGEYGYDGYELTKRRNAIFTAVTRARAWVRICGIGAQMERLKQEIDRVASNGYELSFRVPTADELLRMRKIHRDMTTEEKEQIKQAERGFSRTIELLESGRILPENLSPELLERLARLLGVRGK